MPWKTFALGDLPAVPKEIHLDGARFDEAVRIEGPAGGPKPRVIAPEQRPTFARGVALTNVDVQDLLLVGNVIQTIEFWNVDWPRRRGHYVLCDEIVFRRSKRSKRMPPSGLREAYQALKRKYEDCLKESDNFERAEADHTELDGGRRHAVSEAEPSDAGEVLLPPLEVWLGAELCQPRPDGLARRHR